MPFPVTGLLFSITNLPTQVTLTAWWTEHMMMGHHDRNRWLIHVCLCLLYSSHCWEARIMRKSETFIKLFSLLYARYLCVHSLHWLMSMHLLCPVGLGLQPGPTGRPFVFRPCRQFLRPATLQHTVYQIRLCAYSPHFLNNWLLCLALCARNRFFCVCLQSHFTRKEKEGGKGGYKSVSWEQLLPLLILSDVPICLNVHRQHLLKSEKIKWGLILDRLPCPIPIWLLNPILLYLLPFQAMPPLIP